MLMQPDHVEDANAAMNLLAAARDLFAAMMDDDTPLLNREYSNVCGEIDDLINFIEELKDGT